MPRVRVGNSEYEDCFPCEAREVCPLFNGPIFSLVASAIIHANGDLEGAGMSLGAHSKYAELTGDSPVALLSGTAAVFIARSAAAGVAIEIPEATKQQIIDVARGVADRTHTSRDALRAMGSGLADLL